MQEIKRDKKVAKPTPINFCSSVNPLIPQRTITQAKIFTPLVIKEIIVGSIILLLALKKEEKA